jgi:predicted LPLAT superfamily acyltransferase
MAEWTGKSKGGKFGYAFFIALLKYTNIRVTYFFIWFVAFYFLLFSDKKSIRFYFRKIHKYGRFKTFISIYRNYCYLGQSIIDKVTVLAGIKSRFTFNFEGEKYLHQIATANKGGMLLSAHIGNWEIAGQLLKRIDAKINIVMYEKEFEGIKKVLERNKVVREANIIVIKDGFSHLYEIKNAFANNEIVVMHGDRFLPGANSTEVEFMGEKAKFPTGPLYLASKHGAPVTFVYAVKESATHYHFFASEPKVYKYPGNIKTRKTELHQMVSEFVESIEKIVKLYPLQWFNYFRFWNKEFQFDE